MSIEEKTLWDDLRKGDKSAFDEVYCSYVNVLFNYGKKFTPNSVLVEDCIQSLFTRLWIKKEFLGHTDNIKAYLLISIKRLLLRELGRERKMFSFGDYHDFRIDLSVESTWINDEEKSSRINLLNKSLKKLTAKQKELIYLKFYELLSYSEIAEMMNIEIKAVYKLAARALKFLKQNLQEK